MKRWIAGLLAAVVAVNANAEPIGIPRNDGIQIDGSPSDWQKGFYATGPLLPHRGELAETDDFAARMGVAWDAKGLLFGIWVQDDSAEEFEKEIYLGDSIELFVGTQGAAERYQVLIGPGLAPTLPLDVRSFLNDLRKEKEPVLSVEIAKERTETGYFIEVRLPWSNLGISAVLGEEIALQAYVNDLDTE